MKEPGRGQVVWRISGVIVGFLLSHGADRFYEIDRDRPFVKTKGLRGLRRILKVSN